MNLPRRPKGLNPLTVRPVLSAARAAVDTVWGGSVGPVEEIQPGVLCKNPPPPRPNISLHVLSQSEKKKTLPVIRPFVKQASIMQKLFNVALQREMTWNPVERPVAGYILDGDNGRLNARLGDCPVSLTPSCVTRSSRSHL